MLEELQRRNYSQTTVTSYIKTLEDFGKHFGRPPDQLGPDEIRAYQVYLLQERKQGVRTVGNHTAALRFFFCKTQKNQTVRFRTVGRCWARHPTASERTFLKLFGVFADYLGLNVASSWIQFSLTGFLAFFG
jgi:hypothetical protein